MKLAELHLGGFGKFEDLTLIFPSDFILILGANEAGKTTVADAFPGVLFGFRRSLKHFRDRYRPWRGGRYTASLLLVGGDGRRFLLGRDFEHDRLELFRGQGVRLEPIPEAELEAILLETLGFENPLLFDSTLLLRRQESGLFKRDRAAFWALAEALGLIPVKEEIRNGGGGSEMDRPSRAGMAEETTASAFREGNGDFRALLQERDRVSGLAAALAEEVRLLEERLERVKELQARLGEREEIENELRELRARLADLEEADSSVRTTVAQAEEVANRIASLEVELRYEEEGIHQYELEIDLLEREIALTRTKLEGLDAYLLSPDVQCQLSQRLPVVNEHTTRLGELFPAVDRLAERLKRLRALRYAGLGLGFAAALGSIGFYGHLPAPYCLGGSGLSAAFWLGTLALLIWSKNLRRRARSLNAEIEKREAELGELRAAIENLLHGKTVVQYQAELEAKKLYERDLWHLEQTLAQKKAEKEPAESVERIKGALEEAKDELARLLAAAGCQDLAEMRIKAASQSQEAVFSAEDLRAREESLLGRLKELSALSAALDQNGQAALAAKRDETLARFEEARIRLAELEAEIARRKGIPEGRNERAEAPIELPAVSREPTVAVERAGLDSGLTARMEEILAEITGGRYERIQLEFGPAGLVLGVESREAGRFLEPANLSAGSLAQVRLAMHVAFTERLTGNTNPPFLLDDPFADLDEERLRSTLDFLGRLSRDRQIIFFTCRREMARMLGETGITPAVIELGAI